MAVVAAKDIELVLVHGCPMGGARGREGSFGGITPVHPLAAAELELVKVVLVLQVLVGVDVASVAAKDEHAVADHDGGVVVAGRGRRTSADHASPGAVPDVEHEEVVQHAFAVVPAKDVQAIIPRHHCVLASPSADKLLTRRKLRPLVRWLLRLEIENVVGLAHVFHWLSASARLRN